MPSPIIASALKGVTHISLLDTIAAERFALVGDFGKIMLDMYDTVDASLLDNLAEELDMLGYNGWILAETEQQKRELLKRAIPIKKTMGTPFAIRQAAEALGIKGNIIIQEGISFKYDGTYKYDGVMTYGSGHWALFNVSFSDAENPDLTPERIEMFRNMIEVYKPVRSQLLDINTY